MAREVPLQGAGKTYTLIHGPYERVIAALSAADEPPRWSPMMVLGAHANQVALA